MKPVKLFFAILISVFLTQNLFCTTAFGSEITPKKIKIMEELNSSSAVYYEYHEIDGVIWEYIYGDDGKLISCHPFE